MESRGQYLHGPKDLRTESRPIEAPGPGEVQIAIRATTLCGSDLHYYAHGRNGSIIVREPLCLGHEAAGEIVCLGEGVNNYANGDKVALEMGTPCETCDLCKRGRYNICPKLRFRGSASAWPHYQGSLQERVNHPAKWVHKLPSSLAFDEGALLEPLAVAIHAVRRAEVEKNSTCLVFGAGPVGLLCAAAARYQGCRRVLITDIDTGRVQFAIDNGFAEAGYVVQSQRGSTVEEKLAIAQELARQIGDVPWPDGTKAGKVDNTFECTGVESCVQTSIFATHRGGKLLLVGMGTPNHTLPISVASAHEIDLVPVWRYANCYPQAIQMMDAVGKDSTLPDMRKLITHSFKGLDTVPDALDLASKTKDKDGKLVVKVVVNN